MDTLEDKDLQSWEKSIELVHENVVIKKEIKTEPIPEGHELFENIITPSDHEDEYAEDKPDLVDHIHIKQEIIDHDLNVKEECESSEEFMNNQHKMEQLISRCIPMNEDASDFSIQEKSLDSNMPTQFLIDDESKGSSIFNCIRCEYQTKDRWRLKKHLLVHKGPAELEMFSCKLCDFKTKWKSYMPSHMLWVHKSMSEVETFKCQECNYQTKVRSVLTKHMLRHTQETKIKVFNCDKCSFQTQYKAILQNHQMSHENVIRIKGFSCDKCDYKSAYKSQLKTHKLKHTDKTEIEMFSCDKCSFQTKYRSSLRCHKLSHETDVKMYTCDKCDYQNKFKVNLTSHQFLHKDLSQVELFTCDYCSFQSKWKSSFRKHLSTAHRNISDRLENYSSNSFEIKSETS